jgi:hypothetical protein
MNTNQKIILAILGIVLLINILNPLMIIDLFDWYILFGDGNMLFYLFLAFAFIPLIVAIYQESIVTFFKAMLINMVLFFAIKFFNDVTLFNGDFLILLLFVLCMIMVTIWIARSGWELKNFDTKGLSSYPNPKKLKQGYSWTYIDKIKELLSYSQEQKNIYIDNFRVDRDIPNKSKVEQTQTFINPLDTTKTILALGKMGSGKTEFFNSVLAQNEDFNIYNREVIHDVKGDFTQKFYDENTDFIFNPYDNRGCYWDIWEDMKESESLVMSFILNLIEYHQKEKDFFSSSASSELSKFFVKTHFTNIDKSSSEKWIIFLNEIEKYKNECGDDRTKTSIYANMELGIETFKLFAWQSAQSNIKKFTLKEFLNSKGRLILLNNSSYSKKLYPLFTGFVAMLIEMMLSKDDTKEDLTLLLLDEYLSIKFDEDVRLKLQTQIRSKGGCLLIGVQYIEMQDKKAKQLLDSSKFATLVFNTADSETVQHLCQSFGNVIYEKQKESRTRTSAKESSSSRTVNIEDKTEPFITPKHIQSMPEYHHLTLIPEKEIFYLGYTPLVELETINEAFEKRDLTGYYDFIYKKKNLHKDYTLEEKEVILQEVISLDKDSINYKQDLATILNRYNLQDTNLDDFFKELFEEDNIA